MEDEEEGVLVEALRVQRFDARDVVGDRAGDTLQPGERIRLRKDIVGAYLAHKKVRRVGGGKKSEPQDEPPTE